MHTLVTTHGVSNLPWLTLEPRDLLALVMDGVACIAESMSCAASVSDIHADIGATISYLGMLADTIEVHGSAEPQVVRDVKELGDWLIATAPEELGYEGDENVVQTALRLLKRQYEDAKH